MFYYKVYDQFCFSYEELPYQKISKESFEKAKNWVFYLNKKINANCKNRLIVKYPEELLLHNESIKYINLKKLKDMESKSITPFILEKMNAGKVMRMNEELRPNIFNKVTKKSVTILGLGDVGGTLLTGLRLLGQDIIKEIFIFDLSQEKMKRYEMEMNQIVYPSHDNLPPVKLATKETLFNTDMFIFTASRFVPAVGEEKKDVRMIQFESNRNIIEIYAKMARENDFKGIFAVVSDPVDLLCNVVFDKSNENEQGKRDYRGLKPNQVRGFGLGVMNGRAFYHAKDHQPEYKKDGRVFGPHGSGLIVANSISEYNDQKSRELTMHVIESNLHVRGVGFKPYIAPALSSGAISILETLRGHFNYSTVFIDGIYWGIRNRIVHQAIEVERLDLDDALLLRIEDSYQELRRLYESY